MGKAQYESLDIYKEYPHISDGVSSLMDQDKQRLASQPTKGKSSYVHVIGCIKAAIDMV